MKIIKFFYPIGLLILVIALLLLLFFTYLLFKPFKEPTVTPYPIPITNPGKIVHYDEPITTKVKSCVFDEINTTASVRYQNSEGRYFIFASHDSKGKKGCMENQQNREPIPSSLPPGKYIIYITAVFHVSPLKDVTKVYETEWFTLESSPSGGLR